MDSSAVVALLLREPGWEGIASAILRADRPRLPAPAYVECCLVMGGRFAEAGIAELDALVSAYGLLVAPFTEAHARAARAAFLAYGKGRHPAGLNFGDCLSYAVAKADGLPLLFVGDDFGRTDVQRA